MASLFVNPVAKRLAQRQPQRLVTGHRNASVQHGHLIDHGRPAVDRVFDRYKSKLEQKAEEHGLSNIGQLREAYRDEIAGLRQRDFVEGWGAGNEHAALLATTPMADSSVGRSHEWPAAAHPHAKIKTLSAYLDLDKIQSLGPVEIETVWRLRHAGSATSLCAVIPLSTFRRMEHTARAHPRFILPLPVSPERVADQVATAEPDKARLASLHFLEWGFPTPDTITVLITHLDEFKFRGEYATPHTVVTHHLELAEDKDVVLLQGQVTENRAISVDEAQWLLMSLQKFYGGIGTSESTERARNLLELFTQGSEAFDVTELMDEAETSV